jgi:predicted dehydrogenase
MVGYHKRSDPATMYAKAEIDRLKSTGEIGKLKYVRILMPAGDWVAGGFNDLIQTDEKVPALANDPRASDMDEATFTQYVGFVNYYIHQVNLMRHLLGEPYKVTHADPAGVLLVGQSAGGVTCTIEMSPYTTPHVWEESALIAFERGYVDLRLPAPLAINRSGSVEIYKEPNQQGVAPTRTSPTLPWIHAMRQQAINFIRAIRGEAKPPCDATEAIQDLQVAREYLRLFTGR